MADTYPVVEMTIQSNRPTVSIDMARSSAAARDVIDDTAGAGITDKTWSADKLSHIGDVTLITGNKYRIAF